MTNLYVGLMSGTSLDGIDAVLVLFEQNGNPIVLAHHAVAYPNEVRQQILALQHYPGHNEIARAAKLANQLATLYAEAVAVLLNTAQVSANSITAIGCHGQTIRHNPTAGYTLQLVNLAQLAELTGIDIVGDFRSRDIAAGGQGAPLVPAFHQTIFRPVDTARVIVNIGGIANLTILVPNEPTTGFDSGPGNMLLDAWCHRHTGRHYDDKGQWAQQGCYHAALLQRCLSDPYFAALPPKSTGRELFNLSWLEKHLVSYPKLTPQDVQATLAELTAQSIAAAIMRYAPPTCDIYLCGGGAHNSDLCQRLARCLPTVRLSTTEELGVPVTQVEAVAFAWLARQCVRRQPANLPEVTGARGIRILGAFYPA